VFTINEILKASKGKLSSHLSAGYVRGISTDSRKIRRGEIFIPIKGKRFDGHDHIAPAFRKGALASFSSKKIRAKGPLIIVKDTLKAYHDIARAYREKLRPHVVGVTGSSGKTTTKDMLASILSIRGRTLKTEQNLNNEIGVPQTLLNMKKEHRFAVVEMAMQGLGEIRDLADIARPNIAVITNIGLSHMEYLKTRANVARAKSEILHFQERKDTAVLPADDDYFLFLKKKAKGKVISFGIRNKSDVSADNIMLIGGSCRFNIRYKGRKIPIDLPIPGEHNIQDALAAAAAAFALGVPSAAIKKGLERVRLSGRRSRIIHKPAYTIIDDTYNANPESMKASLRMLSRFNGRKIAVLGDMLELGRISRKSHEEIGKIAAGLKLNALIAVGKFGGTVARSARKSGLLASLNAGTNLNAIRILKKMLRKNDTVLIKGSRGMKMETITESLSRQ